MCIRDRCSGIIILPCDVINESNGTFSRPLGVRNLPSPRCCGSPILFSGSGFGSASQMTPGLRVGSTSNERTEWISDTSTWVKVSAASGNVASLKVAITTQVRQGSITGAVSYDRPSLRSVRIAGLPVATVQVQFYCPCLLYTSPSPRDQRGSRMPSSA